jgi:predicted house-cleaning noncanonical NTP pyrophosphatase (MazG superfamily)
VREKLIRDGIPKLAADAGDPITVRTATPAELPALLRAKLTEETAEAIDAGEDGLLGELADVLEVVHVIAALHGHTPADLEQARVDKAGARGRFEQGLVMQLPDGEGR